MPHRHGARAQVGVWDCKARQACGYKGNYADRDTCRGCGRDRAGKARRDPQAAQLGGALPETNAGLRRQIEELRHKLGQQEDHAETTSDAHMRTIDTVEAEIEANKASLQLMRELCRDSPELNEGCNKLAERGRALQDEADTMKGGKNKAKAGWIVLRDLQRKLDRKEKPEARHMK